MNPEPGPESRGPVAVTEERRAQPVNKSESETLAAQLVGTATRDVAAFTALYDRTCSRTYGVALLVLRDP